MKSDRYVCPRCFMTVNQCKCLREPEYLIQIDEKIQKHIRMLNNKGYITMFCCEGHAENGSSPYIKMAVDYDIYDNLPKPFKYIKHHRIIRGKLNNITDKKEFNREKEKQLEKLMDWIEKLDRLS